MYTKSLKGEDLNALVGLPCLKSVTVHPTRLNPFLSKYTEKCVVEMVNRLKDCAQLVQFEIVEHLKNRSPLIAQAAATYKRKDFDMFIGGVPYRTW